MMNLRNRRLILGGIFFALMFFYHGTTLYFQFVQVGSYTGWRGKSDDGKHFYTTTPDPESPTALTQQGDELIAINGTHPADDFSQLEFSDRSPVGTPFTMTFNRNGQRIVIEGQTVPYPPGKYPYRNRERQIYLLIWLVFLGTGLALLLLKAENRQAWLLALMLGSFSGIFQSNYAYSALGTTAETLISLAKIASLWFLPLFALFFLNFPDRSRLLLRLPRLEAFIYWSNYLLLLPFWLTGRLPSYLRTSYRKLPLMEFLIALDTNFRVSQWMVVAYLAAGFFFIGYNYWQANLDARGRIRVVLLGISPGFLGLFLLVLGNFPVTATLPGWARLMTWTESLLYVALPLIPLSFAYAIIRHKVIPVSLIIRQGLRYLLVSRGATVLVILVVWLAVTQVLTLVFSRWHPNGLTIGWISAVVGIAAMRLSQFSFNRFISPVIDRKFFRQSYDAQQIIADLNDSVRTVTSQSELLEKVATRLQSALQTQNVTIFLRDDATGEFHSRLSCEYNVFEKVPHVRFPQVIWPADGELIQQAADNESPLDLEFEAAEAHSAAALSQELEAERPSNESIPPEQLALRTVNASLLLLLRTKEKIQGMITVGPRLGDLPFSSEDKRLLLSAAAPVSFALENAHLLERMVEDARRREELEAENALRAKELEEARQLQLSMLPKSLPDLDDFEIAAFMKTATEVGGDYYDYALIRAKNLDDILILAIGDATGHGLKAGTVVTATKSLFNAYAQDESLSATFGVFSRALKLMNMRAMYMALSLIRLEGRNLRIVSAGMPPLFIYRAATGEVEEHLLKGVPLGSIKQYPYIESQFTFQPGDWLVLMSDGLPERFNEANEMLGYDPLKELLRQTATSSNPQTLIEHMLSIGDDWAGNQPLDDDITLLVLKAKP